MPGGVGDDYQRRIEGIRPDNDWWHGPFAVIRGRTSGGIALVGYSP